MDRVPLSMDRGTFSGRFLHGVHPPAAALSMDKDIHPWMRFIHRWCTTNHLPSSLNCCTPTVDKPHPWMNVLIGGWSIFIHGCMCSSMDHAVAGGSTPWRIRPMRPSRSMDETAPSVDCITVHLLPLTPKLPYYSGIPQFFLPSFLIRLRDILSSNPAS